MPLWNDTLVPIIKSGKKLIIAAHGNTLRALVKHLDDIPEVAKALTAVAASETHRFAFRCARAPPALRCGQHADAEWVGAAQDVIANLNIPTSVPLVYELDDDLRPIKHAQARPPPLRPCPLPRRMPQSAGAPPTTAVRFVMRRPTEGTGRRGRRFRLTAGACCGVCAGDGLGQSFAPMSGRYLGDQDAIRAAIEGVANQSAAKK